MTKQDVETGDMSEKTSSAKTGYIGIFLFNYNCILNVPSYFVIDECEFI